MSFLSRKPERSKEAKLFSRQGKSSQGIWERPVSTWAEYSLGTINKLIDMKSKDNGSLHECNDEEKRFVQRLKMIRYDIHSMLQSVNADI